MEERTHPVAIEGYAGDLKELGTKIARLRYDAFLLVLYGIYLEINRQMQADSGRGRKKLARKLADVYIQLGWVRRYLQDAWIISKPHIKKELEKTPEITGGQIAP